MVTEFIITVVQMPSGSFFVTCRELAPHGMEIMEQHNKSWTRFPMEHIQPFGRIGADVRFHLFAILAADPCLRHGALVIVSFYTAAEPAR